MNLPKDLALCVRFARFCAEYAVEPADLAELIVLARKAFSAGERECNTGKSADGARDRFEEKAAALGFSTNWTGLYPAMVKNGSWVTEFTF